MSLIRLCEFDSLDGRSGLSLMASIGCGYETSCEFDFYVGRSGSSLMASTACELESSSS
jgi:hypothetical protein